MQKIRISFGSAAILKLESALMETPPTTCYLMTASTMKCLGNCAFFFFFRDSRPEDNRNLSRIQWPEYRWNTFLNHLEKLYHSNSQLKFQRICLQALNYPHFYSDVKKIITTIHSYIPNVPISAALPPISGTQMKELKEKGLDIICFALDACNADLFHQIKGKGINGPYQWKKHLQYLETALGIFGKKKVSTHFIVGLGETEFEMIAQLLDTIQKGINPGIFFFTPVKGTPMKAIARKPIKQFRHIQIARYLLLENLDNFSTFVFDDEGKLSYIQALSETKLWKIINKEIAFYTAGCPNCNRPFYTSRPSEEQDGYPRPLTMEEKQKIYHELKSIIDTTV